MAVIMNYSELKHVKLLVYDISHCLEPVRMIYLSLKKLIFLLEKIFIP